MPRISKKAAKKPTKTRLGRTPKKVTKTAHHKKQVPIKKGIKKVKSETFSKDKPGYKKAAAIMQSLGEELAKGFVKELRKHY